MAWIGAHFAAGMIGGGAVASAVCAVRGRGWKAVPVVMVASGMWAVIPDMPHTVRQDLAGTAFAQMFGSKALGQWLHAHGNWFWFHHWLDVHYGQPWPWPRLGLWGMAGLIIFYNAFIYVLFHAHKRHASEAAHWRAHRVGHELAQAQAADAAYEALKKVAGELEELKKQFLPSETEEEQPEPGGGTTEVEVPVVEGPATRGGGTVTEVVTDQAIAKQET